jgi:hypothetical protein
MDFYLASKISNLHVSLFGVWLALLSLVEYLVAIYNDRIRQLLHRNQ